ncbi:hypothetical protein BSLA_01f5548, partial [Burkholderia stabilis]
RPIGKKQ